MPKAPKRVVVRAHVDSVGELWYARSGERPIKSPQAPPLFVRQPWIANADSVHVLGVKSNVDLIMALYEQYTYVNKPRQIQLGGPAMVRPASLNGQAADILGVLEGSSVIAGSVGGWHTMTSRDFWTYYLMQQLAARGGRVDDHVLWLLSMHPAWPAISFLTNADLASAAHLIAMIVDPRWHVDPLLPDRANSLYSYLGLSPGNMQAILKRDNKVFRHRVPRLVTVLMAWAGQELPDPSLVSARGPGDFLGRVFICGDTPAAGLLQACRVFLRFLTAVWLDNLTPPRLYHKDRQGLPKLQPSSEYSPQLFVPGHFFRDSSTLHAWHVHEANLRARSPEQVDLQGI